MSTNAIETVDLLVVGGGKAGKSLAMERAKAGWKVVLSAVPALTWHVSPRSRWSTRLVA